MKNKLSLIALFAMVVVSALLFSGCDSPEGNKDTCAHEWVWEVKTPATYTADGVRSEHCSKCGTSGGTQTIPMQVCTSHNYILRTLTPSTEEADGVAVERCSRCNHESGETEPIPAGTELDEDYSPDIEDSDISEESSGNDDIEISDDELESILSSTGTNPHAVVGPLVTAKWAQGFPFNALHPFRLDDGSRRYKTNCTNTAVGQIMAFHKHPIRGTGQTTTVKGVTVPLVNLSSVTYDWDNILDHYRSDGRNSTEQQRNAVAALMHHVAAAATISGAPMVRVLVNQFNYDRSFQRLYKRFFTDAEWEAIIRQQLDLGLPVYYAANRESGGHAFVIDGYDSQGRFHVNWGWRGAYNGWYPINGLKPREARFYDRDHKLVINIKPDVGSIGSNLLAFRNFTVSSNSAAHNELITVNIILKSLGYFPGGQRGVALVDTGGNIVEVIRVENFNSLSLSSSRTTTMRCIVPDTVSPGQYQLRIVTRMDGEQEWKIITASDREAGIPNAIPITITAGEANSGGYKQALTSFTASQISASHEDQFTVTFATRNISSEIYPGGLQGAALVDNNNNIVAVIGSRSRSALNPGSTRILTTINCTIPYGVLPGQYRLRIVIRTIDNEEWKIATMSLSDIPTSINFTVTTGVRSPFLDFFHSVAAYRTAAGNIEVIVNQNLTISQLVSIPAPAAAGATLTIRSANPSQRVTLTRGVSGNLFTTTNGATVIFGDIIIDGASGGAFAESSGGTLVRVNGGTFIMNSGAVLRNNANSGSTSAVNGGGVVLDGSTAVFTMSGGEITGNTSGFEAGGVYVNSGSTFTMTGGKINGNTANNSPGGVYVRDSTFTMSGGEISGNTSATMSGVRVLRSTFTLTGGVVAGNGSALTNVVNGTYNLNTAAPNNAVVIAWNRASGTLDYTVGANTDLTVSAGATATWANQSGVLGISYKNGSNTGWIKQW